MHRTTDFDRAVLRMIAENVRHYRGTRSKGSVARAAGMATIQITRIENAIEGSGTMPRASTLVRLAEALGVSPGTLLEAAQQQAQVD